MAIVNRATGPSAAVRMPGELPTRGPRPTLDSKPKPEASLSVDDRRLIEGTLAGEREAFGALVLRYQDRLYSSLLHVTSSAEEACDVAQDAFIQAFVKLSTFQGNSGFFTWLYRIAFNLSVSRRRREKATLSMDYCREATGDEPATREIGPDRKCEQREQASQVRAALATLSEEHRRVLVLRDFDDCSYEEIAEILEIPVGTVRSRIHRARLEMKQRLQNEYDERP